MLPLGLQLVVGLAIPSEDLNPAATIVNPFNNLAEHGQSSFCISAMELLATLLSGK